MLYFKQIGAFHLKLINPFADKSCDFFFLSCTISDSCIMFKLFTRFNSSMQKFFMGKSNKNVANGNAAASSEMEDGNTSYGYVWDDDPSSPLLPGKVNQTGCVPMTSLC